MDPRTPVLVGVGMVEQRCDDPTEALEARELMRRAVEAAAADAGAGAAEVLSRVGVVALPHGQWHYGDPGRFLADAIGAGDATTVIALVGVLQQTLIGDACRRVAAGDVDAALVVGGEARYRALRSRILGVDAPASTDDARPDVVLEPTADLVLESEVRGGLGGMPVGYYAVIESALCGALGRTVDEHRDEVAALYARFTRVAAANPHAWKRDPLDAAFIRDASAKNPMLAFPYTKLHNSSWNVDQATALLVCATGLADAAGIDPSRRLYPLASAESNHALPLTVRPDLASCPGVRVAGRRALGHIGASPTALDAVDLYTCFPAAVQLHARELGIGPELEWTVTGAMPFAGGPFNSYVLQATGRMVEILREQGDRRLGLVSSVSGLLTKHGVGVWSTAPPDDQPFAFIDVSDEVADAERPRPIATADDARGEAFVVGHTVLYGEGDAHAVALVDLRDGARFLARSDDPAVVRAFETELCCGRSVQVREGGFVLR
jgi:acetyl-CoA C-acetyltransferase